MRTRDLVGHHIIHTGMGHQGMYGKRGFVTGLAPEPRVDQFRIEWENGDRSIYKGDTIRKYCIVEDGGLGCLPAAFTFKIGQQVIYRNLESPFLNTLGAVIAGDERTTQIKWADGTVKHYANDDWLRSNVMMYLDKAKEICGVYTNLGVKVRTEKVEETVIKAKPGDFIIWSPEGDSNPTVVHTHLVAAKSEAKRLVKKTGKAFFYAQLIGGVKIERVITETEKVVNI